MFHVYVEGVTGTAPGAVRELSVAMAARYGLPAAELLARLAKGPFRVKANVDHETANAFARDLEAIGARVRIEEAPDRPLATASERGIRISSAIIPRSRNSSSAPPPTAPLASPAARSSHASPSLLPTLPAAQSSSSSQPAPRSSPSLLPTQPAARPGASSLPPQPAARPAWSSLPPQPERRHLHAVPPQSERPPAAPSLPPQPERRLAAPSLPPQPERPPAAPSLPPQPEQRPAAPSRPPQPAMRPMLSTQPVQPARPVVSPLPPQASTRPTRPPLPPHSISRPIPPLLPRNVASRPSTPSLPPHVASRPTTSPLPAHLPSRPSRPSLPPATLLAESPSQQLGSLATPSPSPPAWPDTGDAPHTGDAEPIALGALDRSGLLSLSTLDDDAPTPPSSLSSHDSYSRSGSSSPSASRSPPDSLSPHSAYSPSGSLSPHSAYSPSGSPSSSDPFSPPDSFSAQSSHSPSGSPSSSDPFSSLDSSDPFSSLDSSSDPFSSLDSSSDPFSSLDSFSSPGLFSFTSPDSGRASDLALSSQGLPGGAARAGARPADPFAPPGAEDGELIVDLADDEVEHRARKRMSTPPAMGGEPPAHRGLPSIPLETVRPLPAPEAPVARRAPAVHASAAPDARRAGGSSRPRARFAAGVVIAIVLGFIPAHVVATVREERAYRAIDAKVIAVQAAVDSTRDYEALAAMRAEQLDAKRSAHRMIVLTSLAIWAAAGAVVAFAWFRRMPWNR